MESGERRWSRIAVACMLALTACGGDGSGDALTTSALDSTTTAAASSCPLSEASVVGKGSLLFQTTAEDTPGCAWCHSVGSAPPFERLGVRDERHNAPALVGVMDRHSEEFVRRQIMGGGGLMPPRAVTIDAENVDDLGCTQLDYLVGYLYSLSSGEVLMDDIDYDLDPEAAALGAEVFAATCEVCHRDGGRQAGEGLSFEPQPPVLQNVLRKHSPAMARHMIESGRGNMPSYREQLTDEEIDAVIEYLKTLAFEDS